MYFNYVLGKSTTLFYALYHLPSHYTVPNIPEMAINGPWLKSVL